MSLKNLNVPNKTHSFLLSKLKDKRIFKTYKKFEKYLNINENFIVAVSGGPDSLALSFLTKIYSIKNFLDAKYILIDHKLREDSTEEAKWAKKKLKDYSIDLNILTWNGKKPKKNIQSIARDKRYELLFKKSKELKIKHILLGHHLDDVFENFFLRILRGSGLNGLISFNEKTQIKGIDLIRPLLIFNKKDLIYISNKIFGSYAIDPSNLDEKYKRVRIRNFLKQLKLEGLNEKKFLLTIKNLRSSDQSIKYYTKKNLKENVTFVSKKKQIFLNDNFFNHSHEVIFRSFTEVVKVVGKRFYPTRGKKIERIIKLIKTKDSFKITLGGCVIKKVNNTIILSKEH